MSTTKQSAPKKTAANLHNDHPTLNRTLSKHDAQLPLAPTLPLLPLQNNKQLYTTSKNTIIFSKEQWHQLKNELVTRGLICSGLLTSLFIDVLNTWSKEDNFAINLNLFNNIKDCPTISHTTTAPNKLSLLEIDYRNSSSDVITRIHQIQNKLTKPMRGELKLMPVIFNFKLAIENNKKIQRILRASNYHEYQVAETDQPWLIYTAYEQDDNLVLDWEYMKQLFPDNMIKEMHESYVRTLTLLVENNSCWHAQNIITLPKKQIKQQKKNNNTAWKTEKTLLQQLMYNRAQLQPDLIAVSAHRGQLTYHELRIQSNRLAYLLRNFGIKPNEIVVIAMEKGYEQVIGCYGTLIAGGAFLPIDPALPAKRLERLFEQGDVKAILTQSHYMEKIASLNYIKMLGNEKLVAIDNDEIFSSLPSEDLIPIQNNEDIAYVMFTSGSTGQPKGVKISHAGIVNTLLDLNDRFNVTSKDSLLGLSNLYFDQSIYDVFGLITAGGKLVLPSTSTRMKPSEWVQLINKHDISILNTVPTLMGMLIDNLQSKPGENITKSPRLVLMGGDWIPLYLPERIKTHFKKAQVISLGGVTEASICSIIYPINKINSQWRSIPYGRPLRNQRVYVLDKQLNNKPNWVIGEIYIGGIGVALGYLGNKALTNKCFISDPKTGERLYKTGDLGRYMSDGNIELIGREDDQIQLDGCRIEPGEIEYALGSHPDIKQSVVLLETAEETNFLTGYFTTDNNNLTTSKLINHLCESLPAYMLPQKLIRLEHMPLTASGKIDRKKLNSNSTKRHLHRLFENQVALTPYKAAIYHNNQAISFYDLNQQANKWAHYLTNTLTCNSKNIALFLNQGIDAVVAILAILKIGYTYIPISPEQPAERINYILNDSNTELLLTTKDLLNLITHNKCHKIAMDEQIKKFNDTPANNICTHYSNNHNYIIYTSGSTGTPKGVKGNHEATFNRFQWMWKSHPFSDNEICLSHIGLSFIDSVWEIFGPLLKGISIVLLSDLDAKDPITITNNIVSFNISRIILVPTLLEQLAHYWTDSETLLSKIKKSLNLITVSGEELSFNLAKKMHELMPNVRLLNLYGSTEVAGDVLYHEITKQSFTNDLIPIGKPIDNTQAYIVDNDNNPTKIGIPGEIIISGYNLASGYTNSESLTNQTFIKKSIADKPAQILYKTGDKGKQLADGNILYLGRMDKEINLRGLRINPHEIESHLKNHPMVKQCIVKMEASTTKGDYLCGYIQFIKKDNIKIQQKELSTWLTRFVPTYMIPSTYVILDNFPLNIHGKINHMELTAPAQKNLQNSSIDNVKSIFEMLLSIDILDDTASFFDMGGNSILAIRALFLLNEKKENQITLKQFYKNPSITGVKKSLKIECENTNLEKLSLKASYNQLSTWFIEKLHQNNASYNLTLSYVITEPIDLTVLQSAITLLISRHEVFRYSLCEDNQKPTWDIITDFNFNLITKPLTITGKDLFLQEAIKIIKNISSQHFNLSSPPLLKSICVTGNTCTILAFVFPHIIIDGISIKIFCDELSALYNSLKVGGSIHLPKIQSNYSDFITLQIADDSAGNYINALNTINKSYRASDECMQINGCQSNILSNATSGYQIYKVIKSNLYHRIKKLASNEKISVYAVLLSTYMSLLKRYSNKVSFNVGVQLANRADPRFDNTVGLFANTLPLSVLATGSFNELMTAVMSQLVNLQELQHIPLIKVAEHLYLSNKNGATNIFDTVFTFHNYGNQELTFDNVLATPIDIHNETSKYLISLNATETETEIKLHFEFTKSIDKLTSEQLTNYYIMFLEQVCQNPTLDIDHFHMCDGSRLSQPFNESKTIEKNNYTKDSICSMIQTVANKHSGKAALIVAETSYSYEDVSQHVSFFSQHLASLGVTTKSHIALYLDRSFDMAISILSIINLNATFIPIGRDIPFNRIKHIFDSSNIDLIITHQHLQQTFTNTQVPSTYFTNSFSARFNVCKIGSKPCESNIPAYIMHTSGTTGKPKGVTISYNSLLNFLTNAINIVELSPQDVLYAYSSYTFDISIFDFLAPLLVGATVVICEDDHKLDFDHVISKMELHSVTLFQTTPTVLKALFTSSNWHNPSMKIISIGENLDKTLASKILSSGSRLWNAYGPTEATIWATTTEIVDINETISIGKPLPHNKLYVLNDRLQPTPTGVIGEIYIGGKGIALNYWNDQIKTDLFFISNPFSPNHGKLYKTGDLAYWASDGKLIFKGRYDQQIKLRGQRIELSEIESILITHPLVSSVAVTFSTDLQQILAYVVLVSFSPSAFYDLKSFLTNQLPLYMIPAKFYSITTMPTTDSDKIDRSKLSQFSIDPNLLQPSTEDTPASQTMLTIRSVWTKTLNTNNYSNDTNFFDAGGNSLLSIQLTSHLEEALAQPINVLDIFTHPTVRKFSDYIDTKQDNTNTHIHVVPTISAKASLKHQPIAVIGMAGKFPHSDSLDEYWNNLINNKDLVNSHTQKAYSLKINNNNTIHAIGHVNNIDYFDKDLFNMSAHEAKCLDPQQRKFIEVCWETLENAGYPPNQLSITTGIYSAMGSSQYLTNNLIPNKDRLKLTEYEIDLFCEKDYIASRAAYHLNLTGPVSSINTACSSSLVSVVKACQTLAAGDSDMMLAGAVSLQLPTKTCYQYVVDGILSPDGKCRPFDSNAAGTIPSSGICVILLKRLSDAISAGDDIKAIIDGYSFNNDGSDKLGFTAPSISGQSKCIAAAITGAQINPEQIDYIEAHGTGTKIGDVIETKALTKAYRQHTNKNQYCLLSSVKSNIGHTDSVSGLAGFIKVIYSLNHDIIPATINLNKPNSKLSLPETPFYLALKNTSWPSKANSSRYAGISSFGLGGTNAHIIVREHQDNANLKRKQEKSKHVILILSAQSKDALYRLAGEFKSYFSTRNQLSNSSLQDIAYTLQTGRADLNFKTTVIGQTHADVTNMLNDIPDSSITDSNNNMGNKVVFMLPGQGEQYINMGKTLYQNEPIFKRYVDHCSNYLMAEFNINIKDLLYDNNNSSSTNQILTSQQIQLTTFVTEYSLAKMLIDIGVKPHYMLGHSLGEYVAATLASVFTLEEALFIIYYRGKYMNLMPNGKMLAVALTENEIQKYLSEKISLAAVNSEKLCVLSGTDSEIDLIKNDLSSRNIYSKIINDRYAFHSHLTLPICDQLLTHMSKINLKIPVLPFLSCVSGTLITHEQATDVNYWLSQMTNPVYYYPALNYCMQHNSNLFIEIGPGDTLSNLTKSLNTSKNTLILTSLGDPMAKPDKFYHCLADLWSRGITINWNHYHAQEKRMKTPLPTYPFAQDSYWVDPPTDEISPNADTSNIYTPHWKQINPNNLAITKHSYESFLVFCEPDYTNSIAKAIKDRYPKLPCTFISPNRKDGKHNDLATFFNKALSQCNQHTGIIYALDLFHHHLTDDNCAINPIQKLIILLQAIGSREHRAYYFNLTVITNQAYQVFSYCYSNGFARMLAAASLVANQELTQLNCYHIDISALTPNSLYEAFTHINTLLAHKYDYQSLAVRSGNYYIQEYKPVSKHSNSTTTQLKANGVYILLGATGKIGSLLASALLQKLKINLIIASKHGTSIASGQNVLKHLINNNPHNSAIAIEQVDISNKSQLVQFINNVLTNHGQINGIIHAAGFAGNKSLANISDIFPQDFNAHFSAKVSGLNYLQNSLKDVPLDFCIIMSSMSSYLGGPGSCLYSATNAYVDGFVANMPTTWRSINWDSWHDDPDDTTQLSSQSATQAFFHILANTNDKQLTVTNDSLQQRLINWTTVGSFVKNYSALAELSNTSLITQAWMDTLGLASYSLEDNFFELGGNSFLALKLINQINQLFPFEINLSTLNQYSNLSELINYLTTNGSHSAKHKPLPLTIHKLNTCQKNNPLILVFPITGSSYCYMNLAKALQNICPVYALHADPGAFSQHSPSIVELANECAQIIYQNLTPSECMLGGLSFGGSLSIEMVNPLINKGFAPQHVLLFDSWASYDSKQWTHQFIREEISQRMQPLMQTEYVSTDNDYKNMIDSMWFRMEALLKHTPSNSGVKVTLLKAQTILAEYTATDHITNHWDKIIPKSLLDVYDLPGNHDTIIELNIDTIIGIIHAAKAHNF